VSLNTRVVLNKDNDSRSHITNTITTWHSTYVDM
jgi:hypothetical protein